MPRVFYSCSPGTGVAPFSIESLLRNFRRTVPRIRQRIHAVSHSTKSCKERGGCATPRGGPILLLDGTSPSAYQCPTPDAWDVREEDRSLFALPLARMIPVSRPNARKAREENRPVLLFCTVQKPACFSDLSTDEEGVRQFSLSHTIPPQSEAVMPSAIWASSVELIELQGFPCLLSPGTGLAHARSAFRKA
jgi:hypothetical protein